MTDKIRSDNVTTSSSNHSQTRTLGVGEIMSAASHILIGCFTAFVVYLASCEGNTLFAWHPACMSIAVFLLVSSILMLSPHHYLASRVKRQGRIRLHFLIQASVGAFMLAGFLTIFFNKINLEKQHFTTFHGISGLTTIVLFTLTAIGGVIALYSPTLKAWVKPALMKFLHNCIGVVTFLLMIATVMLGSWWIEKKCSLTVQILCVIGVAIGALLALESSVKSALGRFRSLSHY